MGLSTLSLAPEFPAAPSRAAFNRAEQRRVVGGKRATTHSAKTDRVYPAGSIRGANFVTWPASPGAAEIARKAIVKTLRESGTPLDAQNEEGDTLLHVLCRLGSLTSVRALIAAGAKTDLKNAKGVTALEESASTHHIEVTAFLQMISEPAALNS